MIDINNPILIHVISTLSPADRLKVTEAFRILTEALNSVLMSMPKP